MEKRSPRSGTTGSALGVVVGLAVSLVVVTLFVSCEEGVYLGGPGCLPTDCARRCDLAGRSGGECVGDMCVCVGSTPADADAASAVDAASDVDADTPGAVDIAPDVVDEDGGSPDRPPDVAPDGGVEATEVHDDADDGRDVREILECCPPPDYYPDDADEYGAKACCDPVVCLLTCGGTCVAGAGCVCADSSVPAP